jgi:endoglycosylceramidase
VSGCPDLERARLLPFEQRMTTAIRAVDTRHLVFSEPFVLFNFGMTNTVVPSPTASRAALSFHLYATTPADEPKVVAKAQLAGLTQHAPPLATEYGAITDPAAITRMASTIEHGLISWAFWSYDENLVIDKAKPPTPDNVRQPVLDALARPYASLTNGIPTAWHYDNATGDLSYAYTPRGKPGDDTVIVLGPRAYPNGYAVTVTGGQVVSSPCASALRIENRKHATAVTVHVTRQSSCSSITSKSPNTGSESASLP